MPELTVRALAELINLPAYEQIRILHEQKYPKKSPQFFKIPYYSHALKSIRQYYLSGRDQKVLQENRILIGTSVKLESRRENNLRVIQCFENSVQVNRNIKIQINKRYMIEIGQVQIKLNFDISGKENGDEKRIFYNLRQSPIYDETARTTLEISKWILEQNQVNIPLRNFEYVDLANNRSLFYNRIRNRTIDRMITNCGIIETLWEKV